MNNQSIDDLLTYELISKAKKEVRKEVTGFMKVTYNLLEEFLPLYENNFNKLVVNDLKKIKDSKPENKSEIKKKLQINKGDDLFYEISLGDNYTIKFNVSKNLVQISSLYIDDSILKEDSSSQNPKNENKKYSENFERFCNGIVRSKIDIKPNHYSEAYRFLKRVSEYLINKIEALKDIVNSEKSYSANLPKNEPTQPNEL